jgi:hypothetical protein
LSARATDGWRNIAYFYLRCFAVLVFLFSLFVLWGGGGGQTSAMFLEAFSFAWKCHSRFAPLIVDKYKVIPFDHTLIVDVGPFLVFCERMRQKDHSLHATITIGI